MVLILIFNHKVYNIFIMKRITYLFTYISVLYLTSFSCFGIAFNDAIFPELATSGRALAMGNAFNCLVNDSNSAFYNPAGLGSVRVPHIHISNFNLETNNGWFDSATGGSLLDLFGNFFKGFSLDGTRELLNNNVGVVSYNSYHLMPNVVIKHLTAGYLFSKSDGLFYQFPGSIN